MKNLNNFINEALSYHYNGLTTLHFESVAAAFLYKFELSGQISDGKYENSRPSNHWIWITNTKIVVAAILPVCKDRAYPKIKQDVIDLFNLELAQLCKDNGYGFLHYPEVSRIRLFLHPQPWSHLMLLRIPSWNGCCVLRYQDIRHHL